MLKTGFATEFYTLHTKKNIKYNINVLMMMLFFSSSVLLGAIAVLPDASVNKIFLISDPGINYSAQPPKIDSPDAIFVDVNLITNSLKENTQP